MNRKVLTTLSVFSLALVSQIAVAGDSPLASDMKQIGALVKAISAAVNDASQNAQSAANAGKLIPFFQDAQNQVPDSIAALSPSQQPAALADYKNLLQNEINDATTLQTDFQSNNNADAATVLADMNAIKIDGHNKYNP